MITSLSELYFRFRRFILLAQTKKVIPMNFRPDLILLMRNIWKIFQMEDLSNDQKDSLNQHENILKQWNETGHPVVNMMES